MTFYEAALRILEEAAAPLHSDEITRRAINRGLLSHVGKMPEVTMLTRLAAMAKRTLNRRLMVTQKDTFALVDWMLPEDATALQETKPPEFDPQNEAAYRPAERHPELRAEYPKNGGRQIARKHREDRRNRQESAMTEVILQLLDESPGALTPSELIERARAGDLPDEVLTVEMLLGAMAGHNQKRLSGGLRPLFAASRTESGDLQLARSVEDGSTPLELQQAFCAAANLKFEDLPAQRKRRTRSMEITSDGDDAATLQNARQVAKDARRKVARAFRRCLAALELHSFEKVCFRILRALHFRELRIVKRSKESLWLTARHREGSLELRYVMKIFKGQQSVDRQHVQSVKRAMSHHEANVGLILSTADARREARNEAVAATNVVQLWCGEGLSEKFFQAHLGVKVSSIEVIEINHSFFEHAAVAANEKNLPAHEAPLDGEIPMTSEQSVGERRNKRGEATSNTRRRRRRRRRRNAEKVSTSDVPQVDSALNLHTQPTTEEAPTPPTSDTE